MSANRVTSTHWQVTATTIIFSLLLVGPQVVAQKAGDALPREDIKDAIQLANERVPPKPYVLQSRWDPITRDPDGRPLDPKLAKLLNANPPPPQLYGHLLTPFIRVALFARRSVETYTPFDPSILPVEVTEPVVYVLVSPAEKVSAAPPGLDRFVDARHVVILPVGSRDQTQAIQPIWVKQDTTLLQNAFGAIIATKGIVAGFPRDAIQSGREFVFIYAASVLGSDYPPVTERRLEIRQEDLRAWR